MTVSLERDYDFRVIPLALIDPPPLAMRETMDEEKLRELEGSIRQKGVQSPLGVYQVGDRFVIIYGHRRYIAATNVSEVAVPCRVHKDGAAREEDYKFTENYFREDVNPAEEATYFADLLGRKHNGNIEALAAEFGVTVAFIDSRLDLLRGWPHVFEALKARAITLGAARELNRFKDEGWSKHYLRDAVEQGATIATIRNWRMNNERFLEANRLAQSGVVAPVEASEVTPLGTEDICALCLVPGDKHEFRYVTVHQSCLTIHQRSQRQALQGGS